ncbi:uncharacterized protein LOC143040220 [Oratosquilla oratoria]|uniref:uncharacterized protein LOC143040220 n=1 Tax=Oratosquilla oratoria TaxID=337810 RepID=UPI003F7740CE
MLKERTTAQLLILLSLSHKVLGNYCEWNICGSEQYCCGDNQCCDYVYSLWYFWVGIVFVIILVSACGGLFRYYYRRWNNNKKRPSYSSLTYNILSEEILLQNGEESKKQGL